LKAHFSYETARFSYPKAMRTLFRDVRKKRRLTDASYGEYSDLRRAGLPAAVTVMVVATDFHRTFLSYRFFPIRTAYSIFFFLTYYSTEKMFCQVGI
jgi:hypothetical protein